MPPPPPERAFGNPSHNRRRKEAGGWLEHLKDFPDVTPEGHVFDSGHEEGIHIGANKTCAFWTLAFRCRQAKVGPGCETPRGGLNSGLGFKEMPRQIRMRRTVFCETLVQRAGREGALVQVPCVTRMPTLHVR